MLKRQNSNSNSPLLLQQIVNIIVFHVAATDMPVINRVNCGHDSVQRNRTVTTYSGNSGCRMTHREFRLVSALLWHVNGYQVPDFTLNVGNRFRVCWIQKPKFKA